MSKEYNRYELVHKIKEIAKKQEAKDREERAREEEKEQYIKTINDQKKRRNYALEAYLEITGDENEKTEEKEDDEEC
jgi:hypothetical protein